MPTTDDGGPAFPCPWGCDSRGTHLPADPKGMSLRDYFAGQFLAGLVAGGGVLLPHQEGWQAGPAKAAATAYAFADAMIKARGPT